MESLEALEIPGGWTQRDVLVGERQFHLLLPARPDAFIEELDEARVSDLPRMRSDPFWSQLWQAAGPMAQAVQRAPWPAGTRVLELGCGSGLVGLAALDRGWRVTFSDYVPEAVALALENARRNQLAAHARGLVLDWNDPVHERFPFVVASDVLYDRRNHGPILRVVEHMLADDGECWLGDAGRSALAEFIELARSAGYHLQPYDSHGRPATDYPLAQFRRIVLVRGRR